VFYTHFSLQKSNRGRLGTACLNHAYDSTVAVMSDLFGTSYPVLQSNERTNDPSSRGTIRH